MCGIVGLHFEDNIQPNKIFYWIRSTLELSSRRGNDSCGLVFLVKNKKYLYLKCYKSENNFDNTLRSLGLRKFINDIYLLGEKIEFFIGHTRLATNGDTVGDNNQPLINTNKNSAFVFNGIICNSESLLKKYNLKTNSQNDGEALWLLDKDKKIYSEINGNFSYIKIDGSKKTNVSFLTNNGSLYYSKNKIKGLKKIILSEASFFKKLKIENYLQSPINEKGSVFISDEKIHSCEIFKLKNKEKNKVKVLDIANFKINENLEKKIFEKINYNEKKFNRCTKCILPSSYPFINFDEMGICNYCKSHKNIDIKNKDLLAEKIKYIADNYNDKSILCSLSGGRDSSFALHLLVKEFNIKPITYTYDWGLNTNLARRNVSIMSGSLGVENILIAADIRKKRKNVKKNINAWLKKPHLGIVPLFMAGDKQFISNSNIIKKELGIKLEIFADNKFERTQFKEEFTGFKLWDENKKNHYWKMNYLPQLKMIYFYGKEFLLNPHYLNSSLLDSFIGFLNYYNNSTDAFHIFDYWQWDENKINDILINEYEWETAFDTPSTWRIGDGTQPFYNLIYYLFAGFSENDTLRSIQIREGQIKREEALNKVKLENQPRYPTFKWYCSLFDLDYEETLNKLIQLAWKYEKKLLVNKAN